jgi:hypothetical protein
MNLFNMGIFSCIQNAGHHHAEKRSKEGGLQAALPCISKEKQQGSCNTEDTPKFVARIHQQ